MSEPRILRIYLDEVPLRDAQAGEFNIINRLRAAFESRGFSVELCRNSDENRLNSAKLPGYSLFHMDDPFHPRALTLRRAYFYPFWRIEASAKRWEWEIARSKFDADTIDAEEAAKFCGFWRKQLYGSTEQQTDRNDMVYIPLQGRLLQKRSFQAASPIEMIASVLQYESHRDIVVSFHPSETYTPEERAAVEGLAARAPHLTISTEPMEVLLARCDYVVTENSSVALSGYFFHKPAVLFARIDFHHIAANVAALGVEQALRLAPGITPDYDRYLFWFLKATAINGGSDQAEEQILDIVRRRGWTV